MTEPQAGSDVKSLKTTAKRDGDEWVLNGTKVFITNGGIADVHVVVATVDPALGTRGQASFVIGKDTPGLSQGKKETKLGIRASHTAEIVLEDCRIPIENLLGGEEKLEKKLQRGREGKKSAGADALATFEVTRPLVGASALGIGQAAYEWTLEYLDGQSEGGTPLLQTQRVQQTLADVATELEAARLLVQRAAWMGRNGRPMTGGQGSMSKLKAGDVTMWATTTLMDLVGPDAWNTDYPLEKFFRDAKIYQLFEGTAEIQRMVISRMQAREYAERLGFGAEVAAKAMAKPARSLFPRSPRSRRESPPRPLRGSSWEGTPDGSKLSACTDRTDIRMRLMPGVRTAGGGCGSRWRSTSRCCWPSSSADCSPGRWRCWPTPGTCSPTSARSSWR